MAGELLLSTLRHLWATLAALKIDMALMGGIAVAAWRKVWQETCGSQNPPRVQVPSADEDIHRFLRLPQIVACNLRISAQSLDGSFAVLLRHPRPSQSISWAALRPAAPITPPPGWAALPHR
jgi:hypothetical protein